MKELDLLLERFIEEHSAELDTGAWPELERLLEMEDDCLWDWLQDPSAPGANGYRELLEWIRHERT